MDTTSVQFNYDCELCQGCQHAQHIKYPDVPFSIPCQGSRDMSSAVFDAEGVSPDEQRIIRGLVDPIAWAKEMFNWEPRHYQRNMLHCTSARKVMRCGRRLGKTEGICVDMLHFITVNGKKKLADGTNVPGKVCLIVTPYKSQIDLIGERLEHFVSLSKPFRDTIAQFKKYPFVLRLKNGAQIKGFTAGTKTASGGASIRGQEADKIYLDEMDYMHPEEIEALYIMLQDTKLGGDRKSLWASSTPSGKRGYFYQWSVETPRFKEFYYPSTVNPQWGPEMEAEMREFYGSGIAYQHEVLADWGEEEEGVFQNAYIDRAIAHGDNVIKGFDKEKIIEGYRYLSCQPNQSCVYGIGVDWNNPKYGVQIVVVEFRATSAAKGIPGRYRIVERQSITARQMTQHRAVDEIIKLSYKWNPRFIYVDQGFGTTQIEALHKYGLDHPETKLVNKVKGIDFETKTEIRDPGTKQIVKQWMKPFTINNVVRFFEADMLVLSRADEEFIKQLRDYNVIKRTEGGRPIYTKENDHVIIAYSLAMLAFTMELTDINKVHFTTHIGRVERNFGEAPKQKTLHEGSLVVADKEHSSPVQSRTRTIRTDICKRPGASAFNFKHRGNSGMGHSPPKRSMF